MSVLCYGVLQNVHLLNISNKIRFHVSPFIVSRCTLIIGFRMGWIYRCALWMTAAVTGTVMQRTAEQRPAWTPHCHLWYTAPWMSIKQSCSAFRKWNFCNLKQFFFPLSPYRVNRVHLCLTGIQERKTWTQRIQNSGGYSGGCRRRRVWL